MPILGDKAHEKMVSFLKEITSKLGTPSAILVISAHWEEEIATITSSSHPGIIYDYYGFPAEAYQIQYAAPGHPELAKEVFELITAMVFQQDWMNSEGLIMVYLCRSN